jgi:hypothetical protein
MGGHGESAARMFIGRSTEKYERLRDGMCR